MHNNSKFWGENCTRRSLRPWSEEKNRMSRTREKGTEWRWCRLKRRQNSERSGSGSMRRRWKLSSGEIWLRNSVGRTSLNSWPSRNEEWRNCSTRERLKDCGWRDSTPTGLRRKESRMCTPNRSKMPNGKRTRSKERNSDCSSSIYQTSKDSCPKSWPRCRIPSTNKAKPTTAPNSHWADDLYPID